MPSAHPRPRLAPDSGQFGEDFVGDVEVAVNRLDIVEIIEGVYQV